MKILTLSKKINILYMKEIVDCMFYSEYKHALIMFIDGSEFERVDFYKVVDMCDNEDKDLRKELVNSLVDLIDMSLDGYYFSDIERLKIIENCGVLFD